MANTITATLYDSSGNTLQEKTYSVQEYITKFRAIIEKSPNEYPAYTVNAVEAIADYGHYALEYLAEAKSWTLEDGKYNGMFQQIEAIHDFTAEDLQMVKDAVSKDAIIKSGWLADLNVTNAEMSLNLDSETSIYFYLTVSEDWASDFFAAMNLSCDMSADKVYRFKSDGIPAHKLNEAQELSYTNQTFNITLASASPLAYVNAVLSSTSEAFNTDACRNAMIAIYRYYDCAKTYQEEMKRDINNFNLDGATAYNGTENSSTSVNYPQPFNYNSPGAWSMISIKKGAKFIVLKYQSNSGEILAVIWDNGGDGSYSNSYIGQITAYDEASGQYTIHRSSDNSDAYIIISGGKLSTVYQETKTYEHCALTDATPSEALTTILQQGYELPQ